MASKIAIVSALPPSKVTLNEYGYHLVKAFHQVSDDVEVLTFADKVAVDDGFAEEFSGVERVWSFNSVTTPIKILLSAIKHRPDYILFNAHMASFGTNELSAGSGLATPFLLRLFGFKTSVILHNVLDGIDLDKSSIESPLRKRIIRFGNKLISKLLLKASYLTVTLADYKSKLSQHGSTEHVYHVPHGLFDNVSTDVKPLVERRRSFITFGKFGTYKRLDNLLCAFKELKEEAGYEDVELHIGGSNHQNAPGYIEAILQNYETVSGVHFHGYVAEEELSAFWASGFCCVFDYSTTTGSSGVLSQIMTHGLLPLFPDIDDFKLLMEEEGVNGAHFVANNIQDLKRQMYEILDHPARFQKIVDKNTSILTNDTLHINDIARKHLELMLPGSAKKLTLESA